MKKAQGMSMNIIVVAAIALIILVVLIVIFVQRSGKFATSVEACPGNCVPDADSCQGEYKKVDRFSKCVMRDGSPNEANPICCVSVV
jgi:hypothetical protein